MSRRVMKCRTMDEKAPSSSLTAEALRRLQPIVFPAVSGNRGVAVAGASSRADNAVAGEARRSLAEINANLQRRDEGHADLENALQYQPHSPPRGRKTRAPDRASGRWPRDAATQAGSRGAAGDAEPRSGASWRAKRASAVG